jgi:hypothetical protein
MSEWRRPGDIIGILICVVLLLALLSSLNQDRYAHDKRITTLEAQVDSLKAGR